MRSGLLVGFGVIIGALIVLALVYGRGFITETSSIDLTASPIPTLISESVPSPVLSPSPGVVAQVPHPASSPSPAPSLKTLDLGVDSTGLSKTTAVITTDRGIVKFKFYSNDAKKTVLRLVELINQGFYNGLTFHRVVPGFVVQGGDPLGNGTGGSGQKLAAEFNERRHVEGALAMARAADPNSADSQFYISLGTHPQLDRNYTVFGQVIEGMDVVRQIKVGDKIQSISLQ